MSVNTVHPEYSKNFPKWLKINKVIDNEAECYLRTLDPSDQSAENVARNCQYREDAVLINFSALTLNGLAGLIFRKKPVARLPAQIKYIQDEATEDGRSLNQLARDLVTHMVKLGRVGALVDFPRNENDLGSAIDLKAKIALYDARDITNWSTGRVNGKLQLTLVVLKEIKQRLQSDGFSWKLEVQYRVLRLVKSGDSYIYKQFLYVEGQTEPHETTPKKFDGSTWDQIPFVFAGADNNNSSVDKSPLYDIVLLNIAHYKNSADLEESGHVVGQPTLIVKVDMDPLEFAKANPTGLRMGCRGAYNVGPEGDAKFLQINSNQMVADIMKDKEKQAAFIGARLIAPAGGRETAEAARMRFGSSNSALAHLVDNADSAITMLLTWVCMFQDGNPKLIKFNLNRKFFDENVDPQVIMQGIMLVQEELLPRSAIQNYAREVGFVEEDVSNEELDKEIEKTSKLNKELLDDDNLDPNNEENENGDQINDNNRPRQTD